MGVTMRLRRSHNYDEFFRGRASGVSLHCVRMNTFLHGYVERVLLLHDICVQFVLGREISVT